MFHHLVPTFLRWVSIPFAIAVLASTTKSFIAGPGWIFALLLGALSLIGWAVVLLASSVRALIRRNRKRAGLLPCVLVCSLPLIFLGALSGDYIHLAVMYPCYAVKIRSQPDWQSKEVRFGWGDEALWVTDGMRMRVLIYDASGKTVVGDRPDPDIGGIKLNIQHFIGNFYLALYYSE
jgi:hypothetical protein